MITFCEVPALCVARLRSLEFIEKKEKERRTKDEEGALNTSYIGEKPLLLSSTLATYVLLLLSTKCI